MYPPSRVTLGAIMDQRRKQLADLIKERSFRRGNFTNPTQIDKNVFTGQAGI